MLYTLKNDRYTLTVNSVGAEMISLKNNSGKELLWQSPSSRFWSKHSPLLFPVCGGLKDSKYILHGEKLEISKHGFVKDMDFSLSEISDTRLVLTVTEDENTKRAFPFEFLLTVIYELSGDELLFSAEVKNNSDRVMPFMFGAHPAFVLPYEENTETGDYRVKFNDVKTLDWHKLEEARYVCREVSKYPLSNSEYSLSEEEFKQYDTMIFFGHKNACTLYSPKNSFSVDMSWSDNLPALCIWKVPDKEARFVCIEPWSNLIEDGRVDCNFDTFDMPRLDSGNSETFSYRVKISY